MINEEKKETTVFGDNQATVAFIKTMKKLKKVKQFDIKPSYLRKLVSKGRYSI